VGLAAGVTGLGLAVPAPPAASGDTSSRRDDRTVNLAGDGIPLAPAEYALLLGDLCRRAEVASDAYLLGGEVERFEQYAAQVLGKERAVFMPSGTLANQLAIRALAKDRRRVVVPETSHVYNDTGDACQILSGLNLIPLAPGQATFARAEVEQVLERTAGGRVAAEVGAIVIESPVRRLSGQLFDFEEMKRISALGRERGIGLHLDGARLFIASAYTGIEPAEYAALFDTVYVSLWKYFNSGIGAVLAGPRRVLDSMYHVRRMFGGNLWNGWSAALVARHFMEGFGERLASAVRVSEAFYSALGREPGFAVERIPNGTNVARVVVRHSDLSSVRRRLGEQGVRLGQPGNNGFTLVVNETWNRTTADHLVDRFRRALG
jgi:threonine aldolase